MTTETTSIDPTLVEYIQGHRTGVLATTTREGKPQQTLIAYHFDGNDLAISTRAPTQKAKNISRRPNVSLAVVDGQAQVIIYGKARVIRDQERVLALHKERIRRIALRSETDAELAERLVREERVILLLTPERFYPTTLRR